MTIKLLPAIEFSGCIEIIYVRSLRIKYEDFEVAEKDMYYVLRKARNDEANQMYLDILEEGTDGLYIQDIIRGGVSNDDPRIPRNVLFLTGR